MKEIENKLKSGYTMTMTEIYGSVLFNLRSPNGISESLPATTMNKINFKKELISDDNGIKTWKIEL